MVFETPGSGLGREEPGVRSEHLVMPRNQATIIVANSWKVGIITHSVYPAAMAGQTRCRGRLRYHQWPKWTDGEHHSDTVA